MRPQLCTLLSRFYVSAFHHLHFGRVLSLLGAFTSLDGRVWLIQCLLIIWNELGYAAMHWMRAIVAIRMVCKERTALKKCIVGYF